MHSDYPHHRHHHLANPCASPPFFSLLPVASLGPVSPDLSRFISELASFEDQSENVASLLFTLAKRAKQAGPLGINVFSDRKRCLALNLQLMVRSSSSQKEKSYFRGNRRLQRRAQRRTYLDGIRVKTATFDSIIIKNYFSLFITGIVR